MAINVARAQRILLMSSNADEAGAPRHVETIFNGLKDKFEFILIFGEDGPVSKRLALAVFPVHVVPEMRTAISPVKDIIALNKIRGIINNTHPDLIHCHSAKAAMLGRVAGFLEDIPCVYTVHGWGWRGLGTIKSLLIFAIEYALSRLQNVRYIYVAKSVQIDAMARLGHKNDQGTVIPNGVPQICATEPEDDSVLTIMMPARVSSAKDHESLIRGFEIFDSPNTNLILCGSGTDDLKFKEKVKLLAPNRHLQIVFLGQISDMTRIYSKCHIVALISNFEAMPISLIEAMSCGKAIISSNVGGVSELITNDLNGLLVEKGDAHAIAEAFKTCTNKLVRLRFGENAKALYRQKFAQEIMLSAIEDVYTALKKNR